MDDTGGRGVTNQAISTVVGLGLGLITGLAFDGAALAAEQAHQRENLDRGVVAVRRSTGGTFLSWRLLASDPPEVAFHVDRQVNGGAPVRLTRQPLREATCLTDLEAPNQGTVSYSVQPVVDDRPIPEAGRFSLNPDVPARDFLVVPLRTPPGYAPNDGSVGDLDGDGAYEIVLHQAGRGRDNSQPGMTDPPLLQAYRLDGTRLWEINLGRNIREGAHYTQFIVYDLDGDGRAEIACKTADGTIDGTGRVLGDPGAAWVTPDGRSAGKVLDGPEFLTVFEGRTGAALVSVPYVPPRGRVADWGDDYGNRVDRFLAGVAHLDGRRPSLLMCRSFYTRAVIAAWDWRDGRLTRRWVFDTEDGTPGNADYRGQGNHSLSVADLDGDGRDEVLYGACGIDDDGRGLYSTGWGHGDALHVSDFDPSHPGLEVFSIHERPRHPHAISFFDARTGSLIWSAPSPDVGRGLAADIDPRHPGAEYWASGAGLDGLFDCQGNRIAERKPRSCNFAVWWDGDLLRELLDRNTISKWNWLEGGETNLLTAEGCASNNGTKATPVLSADILGDWREEVVWRTADNRELRIYTTTSPTRHRFVTLMHDPQYRLAVAGQNVGYNQPPHPGFHLGAGGLPGGAMALPTSFPKPPSSATE